MKNTLHINEIIKSNTDITFRCTTQCPSVRQDYCAGIACAAISHWQDHKFVRIVIEQIPNHLRELLMVMRFSDDDKASSRRFHGEDR